MRRRFGNSLRFHGVRWWFLLGERVRIGIAHHGLLQASWSAEGMGTYRCNGDGEYHRLHLGPWCLRWRGRPAPRGGYVAGDDHA